MARIRDRYEVITVLKTNAHEDLVTMDDEFWSSAVDKFVLGGEHEKHRGKLQRRNVLMYRIIRFWI